MAYEFTKLGEVEALEKMPEGANALIEVEGDIKRVPGDGLSGGIKTAIITITNTEGVLNFDTSITFEEAKAELTTNKMLQVVITAEQDGYINCIFAPFVEYYSENQKEIICIFDSEGSLYWTTDGISINPPSGTSTLSAKLSRTKTTTEA